MRITLYDPQLIDKFIESKKKPVCFPIHQSNLLPGISYVQQSPRDINNCLKELHFVYPVGYFSQTRSSLPPKNLQWNLDLTKTLGTGQICSLNGGFIISKTSI